MRSEFVAHPQVFDDEDPFLHRVRELPKRSRIERMAVASRPRGFTGEHRR